MSDSDDTAKLLKISHDVFSTNLSRSNGKNMEDSIKKLSLTTKKPIDDFASEKYSFLKPKQQIEMHNIDVELEEMNKKSSEISGTSTDCGKYAFTHSTPKYGTINRVDSFINERKTYNSSSAKDKFCSYSHINDFYSTKCQEQPLSLPTYSTQHQLRKQYEKKSESQALISLSAIWDDDAMSHNPSPQEEKLRRQHCEKTIQTLQMKLLEYQQKISVAMEIDKAKDAVLAKTEEENHSLKIELKKFEELVFHLENYQSEMKLKTNYLEKELMQAVSLATKFEEKNSVLENKIQISHSSYKKQLDELEIKNLSYIKSAELASEECSKIRDKFVQSQFDIEKCTKDCEETKTKMESLKEISKKSMENFEKERKRTEILENQLFSLNESYNILSNKEKSMENEFEKQRELLKNHYQQQLENVVAIKLREFQTQLDKVEISLKNEAKNREQLIAERAIKQMEMMNEKNEEELKLLLEKHNEEVELYRIQMANASKKIYEMEKKLNIYKSKRADIAEKLHCVMETQWQKALEILTSPNKNLSIKTENADKEDDAIKTKTPENEFFETPTTSRTCKQKEKKAEHLQAFIEMLLSKSPQDLENLDEFFNSTMQNKNNKADKPRQHSSKAPWR